MEPSPSSAPENATQPQRHGDTERFAPPVDAIGVPCLRADGARPSVIFVSLWFKIFLYQRASSECDRFDGLAGKAGQRGSETVHAKTNRTEGRSDSFLCVPSPIPRRFAPPVESNVSAALCLCVSVVAFARCEQGSVAFDLASLALLTGETVQ